MNWSNALSRTVKATITFLYNMDEDPYFEMFEEDASDQDKLDYFRECMAEDLVQMSYGSGSMLFDAIETEIEDV